MCIKIDPVQKNGLRGEDKSCSLRLTLSRRMNYVLWVSRVCYFNTCLNVPEDVKRNKMEVPCSFFFIIYIFLITYQIV